MDNKHLPGSGPQMSGQEAIHALLARLSELSVRQHSLTVTFDHLRSVVEKVVERFSRFSFLLALSGGARNLLPFTLGTLLGGGQHGGGRGYGGGGGGGGGGASFDEQSHLNQAAAFAAKKAAVRDEVNYRGHLLTQMRKAAFRAGAPVSEEDLGQLGGLPTGDLEAATRELQEVAYEGSKDDPHGVRAYKEALDQKLAAYREYLDQREAAYQAKQKSFNEQAQERARNAVYYRAIGEEVKRNSIEIDKAVRAAMESPGGLTQEKIDAIANAVVNRAMSAAARQAGAEAGKSKARPQKVKGGVVQTQPVPGGGLVTIDAETLGTGEDAIPVQLGAVADVGRGLEVIEAWAEMDEDVKAVHAALRAKAAGDLGPFNALNKDQRGLYKKIVGGEDVRDKGTARVMGFSQGSDAERALAFLDAWERGLDAQGKSPDAINAVRAFIEEALAAGLTMAGHHIGFDLGVFQGALGGGLPIPSDAAGDPVAIDSMRLFRKAIDGSASSLDQLVAHFGGLENFLAFLEKAAPALAEKYGDAVLGRGRAHSAGVDALISYLVFELARRTTGSATTEEATAATEAAAEAVADAIEKAPPTAPTPVDDGSNYLLAGFSSEEITAAKAALAAGKSPQQADSRRIGDAMHRLMASGGATAVEDQVEDLGTEVVHPTVESLVDHGLAGEGFNEEDLEYARAALAAGATPEDAATEGVANAMRSLLAGNRQASKEVDPSLLEPDWDESWLLPPDSSAGGGGTGGPPTPPSDDDLPLVPDDDDPFNGQSENVDLSDASYPDPIDEKAVLKDMPQGPGALGRWGASFARGVSDLVKGAKTFLLGTRDEKKTNEAWQKWWEGAKEKGFLATAAGGIKTALPGAINMGTQMLSAGNPVAWQTLQDSFSLLGGQLSQMLLPTILEVVSWLQSMAKWIRDMSPATKAWIAQVVKWTAVIAAVIVALNFLISTVGMVAVGVAAAGAALVYAVNALAEQIDARTKAQEKAGEMREEDANKYEKEANAALMGVTDPQKRAEILRNMAGADNQTYAQQLRDYSAAWSPWAQAPDEELRKRSNIFAQMAAKQTDPALKNAALAFGKSGMSPEKREALKAKQAELASTEEKKGILMSLRAMAASPQYKDIENAYKSVQLDVLSKDPMLLELEKMHREGLLELVRLQAAGNEKLEQQVNALGRLFGVEASPTSR